MSVLFALVLALWIGLAVYLTGWLIESYKTGKYWDVLPRRLVSRETDPERFWGTLKILSVVDGGVILMATYLAVMAVAQLIRLVL